jgi:hypothetical protein
MASVVETEFFRPLDWASKTTDRVLCSTAKPVCPPRSREECHGCQRALLNTALDRFRKSEITSVQDNVLLTVVDGKIEHSLL